MRKSTAPSCNVSNKRPKFIPPFSRKNELEGQKIHGCSSLRPNQSLQKEVRDEMNVKSQGLTDLQVCNNNNLMTVEQTHSRAESGKGAASSSPNVPFNCIFQPKKLTNVGSEDRSENILHSKNSTDKSEMSNIAKPHILTIGACASNVAGSSASRETGNNEPAKVDATVNYYSVVWGKISKRKHKKWEGDAVLVTKGKSVRLLDMDGKEIGKGSGYKLADIGSLAEGNSLYIGGKQIEVMNPLAAEEFTSGRCFTTTAGQQDTAASHHIQPPQAQTRPQVGMEQLLHWDHIPQQHIQRLTQQDPCLSECSEHITFVFRNTATLAPTEAVSGEEDARARNAQTRP